MTSPEARISRKIVKWLNLQPHTFVWKNHGSEYMPAGLPDIVGVVYGRFIGIETKRPETRNNLSARQQRVRMQIIMAGGVYGVATSVAEAQSIWDRAANGHGRAADLPD